MFHLHAERFWQKVRISPGCWEWTASLNDGGYGRFYVSLGEIKESRAHRFSWMLANDSFIPDSLQINHRCDNRKCVNPAHLYAGTALQNSQDARERGRLATGDKHRSRTHPESIMRGDNHPNRVRPERMARGASHGLRKHPEAVHRGSGHYAAKIDESDVNFIQHWLSKGYRQWEIAQAFKVSQGTVSNINLGKGWCHV